MIKYLHNIFDALPDNAGLNGEMPHHMENRESIIARLREMSSY